MSAPSGLADGIEERLTVCVGTYARPYCIERLVRSIRANFPRIPIIVGDQNGPRPALEKFYAENAVEALYVGHDVGVARARQACVNRAATEYVLVCDDDFIFSPETRLDVPLTILDRDKSVDIVGGLVRDINGDVGSDVWTARRWERFLFRDRARGLLLSIKIDAFSPMARQIGDISYFACDTVMNWKVVRWDAFDRGACWDPTFKCNGEHEDFYLNVRENTALGVVYCPQFIVYHHSPFDAAYASARNDQIGWHRFAEKWGLRENIELFNDVFRCIYAKGYSHVPGEATAHPDWIPHQTSFHFDRASDAAKRILPPVSPFAPDQMDAASRLQLRADRPPVGTFRPGHWLSTIVHIENPTSMRIGCRGESAPSLSYRVMDANGAVCEPAKRHLTRLCQDIPPGDSHHVVNIAADWPARDGEPYSIDVDLWCADKGWLFRHDRFQMVASGAGQESPS